MSVPQNSCFRLRFSGRQSFLSGAQGFRTVVPQCFCETGWECCVFYVRRILPLRYNMLSRYINPDRAVRKCPDLEDAENFCAIILFCFLFRLFFLVGFTFAVWEFSYINAIDSMRKNRRWNGENPGTRFHHTLTHILQVWFSLMKVWFPLLRKFCAASSLLPFPHQKSPYSPLFFPAPSQKSFFRTNVYIVTNHI